MKHEILKFLKSVARSYGQNLVYGISVKPGKFQFANYVLKWVDAFEHSTTDEGAIKFFCKYKSKLGDLLPSEKHKHHDALSKSFNNILKQLNHGNGNINTGAPTLFDKQEEKHYYSLHR